MFDLGPEKLLFVFAAALIFLGPKEIPAAARTVGKVMRQVRSVQDTLKGELSSMLSPMTNPTVVPDPTPAPITSRELSPTAPETSEHAEAEEPGFGAGPSSFL